MLEHKVLEQLVPFLAHRLLQGLEGGRRRDDQVLQAGRLRAHAGDHALVLRLERPDLALKSGDLRSALRRILVAHQLEKGALGVRDLRAQHHRLRIELLLRGPFEAELAAGEEIGEDSGPRALEKLERLRVAAAVEELLDRGVVEADPILQEGAPASLVAERAPIALEGVDRLKKEASAASWLPCISFMRPSTNWLRASTTSAKPPACFSRRLAA